MENKLSDFIPITVISPPDPPQQPPEKKIKWGSLLPHAKSWAAEPINMALLLWLASVAAFLFLLFLLMTGLLNPFIPLSSHRKSYIEAANQILNALFAMLCLYQHPKLIHHLFLLLRWTEPDRDRLYAVYAGPDPGPNPRTRLGLVVILLHLTCFSQYVICGLFWGFSASSRPDSVVNTFIAFGIIFPVAAGGYTLHVKWRNRGGGTAAKVETSPERDWAGGVFSLYEDLRVFWLSLFCTPCVFGWNAERLGLGNKYVHVATFSLVFLVPFLVFSAAAMKIEFKLFKDMAETVGIVLSCCGFVYGGYWRTRMRRKMKLTKSYFCFGNPNFSDCFTWVFCWACSLAQEVRTGNLYGVEEGKEEEEESEGNRVHPLSVLPPRPLAMSAAQ